MPKTHQSVASCTLPTRDLTCNPGTCPHQESNGRSFTLRVDANPRSHTSEGTLLNLVFKI